jgi:hypothetical protein
MTERDTNTGGDESRPTSDGNASQSNPTDNTIKGTEKTSDDIWAAFEQEHAQDLNDIAHSRNAKRFEKHAKRQEKETLLSVDDLDVGTFTDDMPSAGRGPRDFSGSSWLDTDNVMNQGSDFIPPNPVIGHVPATKAIFLALLVIGILGIIASVLLPKFAGILGSIFGVCILIGGAGLITGHRGHNETRSDYFDDGARI